MSHPNPYATDDLGQSDLAQANLLVQNLLASIAADNEFVAILNLAFGHNIDVEQVETLRQQWLNHVFDGLPEIELRSATEINHAKGAFSAATGKIYLSQQYLDQNVDNPAAIANILLEEIGHFVDTQINTTDAIGDEGAIFASLVQAKPLDDSTLQKLKSEDDTAIIILDGQQIEIEQANNQVIFSGIIRWTDNQGKIHAVRESTVQIWDKESNGEDELVTTVTTDQFGSYTATFDNDDGLLRRGRDIYIKVLADGPHHFVEGTGTQADTRFSYTSKVIDDIPDGVNTLSTTILKSDVVAQAFSVSDAIYVGSQFAKNVRGTPPVVEVNYGEVKPGKPESSFFSPRNLELKIGTSINIGTNDGWDWDVILHEYGHFLSEEDQLDNSPGGSHSAGKSLTSQGYDKGEAIRLAWGEGLATYLSIAAQEVADANGILPTVPYTGDTYYTDSSSFIFDSIEYENSLRRSTGETDELSVSRILLDLADSTQDTFRSKLQDDVSYGYKGLYDLFKAVPKLETLDDLWDHFKGSLSNRKLADVGAIFEEYSVSPEPINFLSSDFTPEAETPPPSFIWNKGNNNANDQFQVIIFDQNFYQVAVSPVLGNVNGWTLDAEQWAELKNQPGNYYYVVAGSDTDNAPNTGYFWSGARLFHIRPEMKPLPPDVTPDWNPGWGQGWTPTHPPIGEEGYPPIGGHDNPAELPPGWTPEDWEKPNTPNDSQQHKSADPLVGHQSADSSSAGTAVVKDPLTGEEVGDASSNLIASHNSAPTNMLSNEPIVLGEEVGDVSGNFVAPQNLTVTNIVSTETISLGAAELPSDTSGIGAEFPVNDSDLFVSHSMRQGSLSLMDAFGE